MLTVWTPARSGAGHTSFKIMGPKRPHSTPEFARADGERMLQAYLNGGEPEARRVQRDLQVYAGAEWVGGLGHGALPALPPCEALLPPPGGGGGADGPDPGPGGENGCGNLYESNGVD